MDDDAARELGVLPRLRHLDLDSLTGTTPAAAGSERAAARPPAGPALGSSLFCLFLCLSAVFLLYSGAPGVLNHRLIARCKTNTLRGPSDRRL
jgi:hypothetical protein